MDPRARLIARLLLAVVGLSAGVLFCELGLRVAVATDPAIASRFQDPLAILIEPYGEFGFRQKPGSVFEYPETGTLAVTNAAGYRGPVVSVPKPPGVTRIVLLGGSATHGWGVGDDQTIDGYMREMFAARDSGTFEVVNLAFDAHDSWQMYERLRADGAELEPDVVIMNAGVNDVRNGRFPQLRDVDPRTLIWESALHRLREAARRGGVPLWLRVKHYVYLARVPSFLSGVLYGNAPGPVSTPQPYPDAIDYFERNVRRVAESAFVQGAALILSTEPSSLKVNYRPTDAAQRSYWIRDAATTQEYRDSLAARMRLAQRELAALGHPIRHVEASIPAVQFLDDAHLTAEGNRVLAEVYVNEVTSLLRAR